MTDDVEELRFEWDPAKAASNLRDHKVSFEAATFIFDDDHLLEEDDRFAEGEFRIVAVGKVDGEVLTVVYAEPEEGVRRIISARVASPEERKTYEHSQFHP